MENSPQKYQQQFYNRGNCGLFSSFYFQRRGIFIIESNGNNGGRSWEKCSAIRFVQRHTPLQSGRHPRAACDSGGKNSAQNCQKSKGGR